jgi:hypothetical protein
MATIKITGFNAGEIVSSSTTDVVVADGSAIFGDADTDSITVNAEFDSDLIPDVDNAVDLGSATKAWRGLYVGTGLNLQGSANDLSLNWVDPTQNRTITFPDNTGTVALDGSLPSLLAFGQWISERTRLEAARCGVGHPYELPVRRHSEWWDKQLRTHLVEGRGGAGEQPNHVEQRVHGGCRVFVGIPNPSSVYRQ